jgi:hypothetical protein
MGRGERKEKQGKKKRMEESKKDIKIKERKEIINILISYWCWR